MPACGATCGITQARARELHRAWGVARGELASGERSVGYDELVALARGLEEVLPVRCFVRLGELGSCDSLYVLAGLRRAALVAVADGQVNPPERIPDVETYVRVSISPKGPFVMLQEVRVRGAREGDALWVVEEPLAGIVDRRLQHIVKGMQGALRKAKLVVLDCAKLLTPEDGVTLWSLLFEPESPMSPRAAVVPMASGRAPAAHPLRT